MRKMFLTPPSTPEEVECRTLTTPNTKEWLGVFNSALLELLNPFNWEQVEDTDLTVDETIELIRPMLEAYWDTTACADEAACLMLGLYAVLRLNVNGHIQQLIGGEWVEPVGDYETPPPEPREEATEFDRLCAAAANATNVLQLTYEEVTDAVGEGIDVAEFAVLMATELTLLLAPAFGFIAPAMILLIEAAAFAFLEIAEEMATDAWDSDFTELLQCLLFNCASEVDDVVSFDWDCVNTTMADQVNLISPDGLRQLKLFGQVQFMLSIIGSEGLNIAGGTTGVETFNCDPCHTWCYQWFFTGSMGEWVIDIGFRDTNGFSANTSGDDNGRIHLTFPSTVHITTISIGFSAIWTGTTPRILAADNSGLSTPVWTFDGSTTPNSFVTNNAIDHDFNVLYMNFDRRVGAAQYWGGLRVTSILLRGEGDNPFGFDNCS